MSKKTEKTVKKRSKNPLGLTDRQYIFCLEYVKDFNGAKAAIRAGYTPRTAKVQASRMLTYANVSAAIQFLKEEAVRKHQLSVDRILKQLCYIGFADLTDVVKFSPDGIEVEDSRLLDEPALAAVSEVSETHLPGGGKRIRLRIHDKVRALVVLLNYVTGNPTDRDGAKIIRMPVKVKL